MVIMVTGPMGSGKSAKLISTHNSMVALDIPVMVFKPKMDTRSCNFIKSRNGSQIEAIERENFAEILIDLKNNKETQMVFVDETQFLKFEGFMELYEYLMENNIDCMLGGIDLTSEMVPFETMQRIMPFCQQVRKISAQCKCGKKAHYSKCLVKKDSDVLIGDEIYAPTCYKCFKEEI